MIHTLLKKINSFINSSNNYPVLSAIAAGLYPFLYYYNKNFEFAYSWVQFFFLFISFIIAPAILFFGLHFLFTKIKRLQKFQRFLLPILNFSLFSLLIVISTSGLKLKLIAIIVMAACFLGFVFYKHLLKVIVLQFLLVIIILFELVPYTFQNFNYSLHWMQQPDNIEQVVFKKKPNIYVIQPDGYANFSELKNDLYKYDNSTFETYLKDNDFSFYDAFRSNYSNTITSNSSMFSMKHHYYHQPSNNFKTAHKSRKILAGNNPVISILKKNDYNTSLILEIPYLLVNRPPLLYDYCNINYSEISYLARGFEMTKDVTRDLGDAMDNNTSGHHFYFVEKIIPGHISVRKNNSKGKEKEREKYISELKKANDWLQEIINMILEKDKNSLIIITADHGGYVGFNYTAERRKKTKDRDLIHSIFTSALAIKWPEEKPDFSHELKSNVNLFRFLFSYLSEDLSYLNSLQDDKSYLIINEEAPFGVYEVIDEVGNVVFNKIN